MAEKTNETKSFVRAGDQTIAPEEVFYIVNVNHEKLLDTHGSGTWVWSHGGRSVMRVIAENKSKHAGNLRWQVVSCPHQEGVFYLYNIGQKAFLDTHGSSVKVWNHGGRSQAKVIEENTSKNAGNLRWQIVPCPHQPGTFYIVNSRFNVFLDTHGNYVWVWDNGGRSQTEIIQQNTSKHAGNLRWCFINVRKQDRFGSAMKMFGMETQRTKNLLGVRLAKKHSPLPKFVEMEVARSAEECHGLGITSPGSEYIRAYTKETLYRRLNRALLDDDADEVNELGQFVVGLMDAIKARSQKNPLTYTVWRGMEMDDTDAYLPGQKFLWPNFVSTTQSRDCAFDANTLFEIDLSGKGVTYAAEVSQESKYGHEQEVLLYPYSGFVVTDRSSNGKQTVIRLRTLDTLVIETNQMGCDESKREPRQRQ